MALMSTQGNTASKCFPSDTHVFFEKIGTILNSANIMDNNEERLFNSTCP